MKAEGRERRRARSPLGVAVDELRLVAVAVAACLGTFVGLRIPAWSAGLAAAALTSALGFAVATRTRKRATPINFRAVLAVVMLMVGLSCLRGRHAAGAYQPLEAGSLRAEAVVRGDPEPAGNGWRAELQLASGERLEATAFGRVGFDLRTLAVGERVMMTGRIRPIGDRPWLRARHIVGRVSLAELSVLAPATGFDRFVNELRSVVIDGAGSFDDRDRPLYTGLVIGDDRFQSLAQRAQFRASGLTHLLAVSGQNVAFVLLVVRPLLMAFGRRARLAVIVAVLVLFAAMTRAEPSVLRASTAAGVAAWALATGRIGSGLRTLSVGVTALVLIDPFLLDVVGFQLSVAASLGIIVVSPLVFARLPTTVSHLPGLNALTQALALTVGAQIGVAPLLIHHFGPLPLASIPANLVAGWAAGAVMTLGLTVGPISGLLQRARFPLVAASLQWPSRLLVGWVDGTARWAAHLGLPRLDPPSMAALAVLAVVVALRPRPPRPARAVVAAAMLVAAVVLAGAGTEPPDGPAVIAEGVLLIPGEAGGPPTVGVLVVRDPPPSAVDAVLASGVGRVDVVITERGDPVTASVVDALIEVVDPTTVLAPPHHRIRDATRVTAPTVVATRWGHVIVEPESTRNGLTVTIPTMASPAAWVAGSTHP